MGNFTSENSYTDYRWLEKINNFSNAIHSHPTQITTSFDIEHKLLKSSTNEDNFQYDSYKGTFTLNNNIFFRIKTPIQQDTIYRPLRNSSSNFKLITPYLSNQLDELNVFYFSDIFDNFQVDTADNFIIQFTHHVTVIHNDLIRIFNDNIINHLETNHNLKNENFTYSKLRNILAKDFAFSKNDTLKPYNNYFVRNLTNTNFFEIIPQMLIEEGQLFTYINDIISGKEIHINVLFYLLCLLYVYGNNANHYEICHTYKNINHINTNIFKESNIIMNFEYISTTKNKEYIQYMDNVIDISYETIVNKNWYLGLKYLDTKTFSQYKSEKEVIIQPYSVFEVLSVTERENGSYYIKLYMKSNSLNDCVNLNMIPKTQLNLGVCIDIGSNIFERYPTIQLDKVVSLTINNKDTLFNNLANIGCMKNIRVFDIQNIELNDDDIALIVPYISNFTYLNYLNLSMNHITYVGVKTLCQIFSYTPYIEYIDLNQNNLTENGGVELANEIHHLIQLRGIGLKFNFLNYKGINALSYQLPLCSNLKMLNLTGNFIYSEEIDTLIWAIKSLKKLMYLNLSINQIASEGLAMLGSVLPETIQHLNFSENRISSEGFIEFNTYLKQFPNLLSLVLYGNMNGPSSIESLGENFKYISQLQTLNLGCNYIGDYEIMILTRYFDNLPNLLTLNLSENSISNNGMFNLIQSLPKIISLMNLDLGWNNINGDSLKGLAKCLSNLVDFSRLNLDGNPIMFDSLQTLLNELNEYTSNWEFNKGVFNKVITNKKELFAEKYILQKKRISKEVLQYINISNEQLTQEIQNISQYEHVKKLIIEKNEMNISLVKILVNNFKSFPYLNEMSLSCNNLTNFELIEVSTNINQLQTLEILLLRDNLIGSLGTQYLANSFVDLPLLRVLNLSWNSIGDDGLIAISHAIIPNLEILQLDNNEINIKGIIEFSANLKNFNKLISINLSWNNICSEGLKHFSKNMNQISNLHILELGHTQIGDDGIEEFIANINSLHKLEKIVLLNNNFTDIGGNALINVISQCRSLKIIEISGNQLSENLINKFNELERKNIVTLESYI